MANYRRRGWGIGLVVGMIVILFLFLAAAAYATSWWGDKKYYGNDYWNRAAVTIFDTGGVNAATQMWHVTHNVSNCALAARLYSGSWCVDNTGWVNGWISTDDAGCIKLTTPRHYGYLPQCFGWGNSQTNGGYRWETHQTSRHDYSD